MKDLLKSKTVILFIMVVLSLVYMNTNQDIRLDENVENNEQQLALNI